MVAASEARMQTQAIAVETPATSEPRFMWLLAASILLSFTAVAVRWEPRLGSPLWMQLLTVMLLRLALEAVERSAKTSRL